MYGNLLTVNTDTETLSNMFLKNNASEALNQILFPVREKRMYRALGFYYLLYCGYCVNHFLNIRVCKYPREHKS